MIYEWELKVMFVMTALWSPFNFIYITQDSLFSLNIFFIKSLNMFHGLKIVKVFSMVASFVGSLQEYAWSFIVKSWNEHNFWVKVFHLLVNAMTLWDKFCSPTGSVCWVNVRTVWGPRSEVIGSHTQEQFAACIYKSCE